MVGALRRAMEGEFSRLFARIEWQVDERADPAEDRPDRKGHCFPAGHASGGFALLGLMCLRRTHGWMLGGLALGLGMGWWMGGYQMLKGAHYLSHTLTTMLLAWIVMLLWRRIVRPAADGGVTPEV